MKFRKEKNGFVLVLEPSEEIAASVNEFCRKYKLRGGLALGIGTVKKATLAYYDERGKKYREKVFKSAGGFELLSLAGNVSETGLHAHVVLGDKGFKAWGGHLKNARVSATCELFLLPFKKIRRELDARFNLKLMKL